MATRRLLVFLAGALAIGVGAAWVASDFRPVSPIDQTCLADVPYAVDVREDQATFDLAFEAGTRYRVIVASLAAQDVESRLTLSAESVPGVERFPLCRVPPLQSAIPKQFNTSWNTSLATPFPKPQGVPHLAIASEAQKLRRAFFLHVTDGPLNDARQYAKVSARRVAEGRFVRVFLDSQMQSRQLAGGLVAEIVRLFDAEIVPQSRRLFGEFRDVDGDGKFAILISPWLGKLARRENFAGRIRAGQRLSTGRAGTLRQSGGCAVSQRESYAGAASQNAVGPRVRARDFFQRAVADETPSARLAHRGRLAE